MKGDVADLGERARLLGAGGLERGESPAETLEPIETIEPLDVLVVGSGVAGLSAAVRLATLGTARVGVLTKGVLEQSATRWAQGGVAAVLPGDEDSTDQHLADTLQAGADLCDEAAVRVLVDEGSSRVTELIALGAVFDELPNGKLARAMEGGHSSPRILHAGGTATGAEVERALVEAVEVSAAAILEHWFAVDLLIEDGRCRGVIAIEPSGRMRRVEAEHVLLACGGAGQLFSVTTNPDEATGDGVAMALRAGVLVTDVEFVQFHPTALHHPVMPRSLISEALRGHGAVLRNLSGERFVDELRPRDVVSRAIAAELSESGAEHVWLDCTSLEDFSRRFPTIHASLGEAGFDPSVEWLPVAPAAHYLCGGVVTDLDGASSLDGLWAAGEVACTGVHGANRLASNSLLEGMVFGARVVDAIVAGRSGHLETGLLGPASGSIPITSLDECSCGEPRARQPGQERVTPVPRAVDAAGSERLKLQRVMTRCAGVVREPVSLAEASRHVAAVSAPGWPSDLTSAEAELRNLCDVAQAVLESATARTESRGAHTRADFPGASMQLRRRYAHGSHHRTGLGPPGDAAGTMNHG
ncbi:MAG: L-aspartate oxidase [Acidimicrobiales bacterium]